MSTPSLLNIPYVIKAGTLYSQIPETGAGDFSVTRATTPTANRSTRINANGFIELVNDNVPRLDYPLGGAVNGCASLLVEPSATNLALRSEEFNVSATWAPVPGGTGVNPVVTPNAVISPDGTQNAETVLLNRGAGNTIGDQSTLQQTITLATSGTYTFSVYAKATSSGDVGKQIFLRVGNGGALIPYTLTANWVRLTRTETGLASGSNVFQIGNRGTVTADNSVSVDLWGAQVETGSVPTSYIPTTTQAITRGEDRVTKTGITSLIGQTEGTFYFDGEANFASSDLPFINRSIVNSVLLIKNASNQLVVYVYYGGVFLPIFTTPSAITGPFKVAVGYKQGSPGSTAVFVNGVQVGTTNTASWAFTGALTEVVVRAEGLIGGAKPYKVRALGVYPNRLSNSELIALTTP